MAGGITLVPATCVSRNPLLRRRRQIGDRLDRERSCLARGQREAREAIHRRAPGCQRTVVVHDHRQGVTDVPERAYSLGHFTELEGPGEVAAGPRGATG